MLSRKPQPRTSKSDQPRTPTRGFLLGGLLALWMAGLVARLYYLQIIQYVDLLARAQRQQQRTVEVAPQRGEIFDRQMCPLAMSLPVDSIYAVPAEILDREMTASLLAPVVGVDAADLVGRFNTARSFCWIKRKVSAEESTRARNLGLEGIYFQKEMKRFYPKGTLAAQVLGYAGLDDRGLAGLEYGLENAIHGRPGRILIATDARRQSFHSSERQGQPGKDVVLTLDENIQYIAEKTLAETVEKWHASGGAVVVENPNTGEILALASEPTFNPNDYARSKPSDWLNRGIAWIYEPGSTFKLVTVSAALEENLTTPQEVIDCQGGAIVLAGRTIHDDKPHGELTVEQVLVHSSDVGAIKLALRLGEERLYRYMHSYGFGSREDIELPGEERGLLKPPSGWSGISIGEMSIGQEVGVTPLQILTAYSTIANGGVLLPPRIVHDIFRGGAHDPMAPPAGHRVVSERTAEEMRHMFEQVVEQGTGLAARLDGYSAGGKTGTAQKIDANGHYSKSHYVASFVGFAPVRKPAVTILVVIDTPVGAIYGAEVAAPAFRSIAEQTLGYLNVPQDNPSRWPQVASSAPAGPPRQKRRGWAELLTNDPESSAAATSPVQPVSYELPVRQSTDGTVVLSDGPLTAVPDFSGLALRRVAEECEGLGFDLTVSGSGLALQQNPAAGARVPEGTRVWVKFAR